MPQSVEGSLTAAYLAPNTFIHKRDIRKKIFKRYKEENLFDWAIYTGRIKQTDNTRFNWFELGYLYGYGQIASSSATAYTAGTKVTVVMTAASHTNSGTKSPGKKWDTVLINNIRGWIQSEDKSMDNAHSFVVKPILSTDNITGGSLNFLTNAFIAFFSSAKADGTGMPNGMVRTPDQYYNYTQIIPTQYLAYGSESANKTEVEVGGQPYYYLQGVEDAANKHNLDMMYAFILGEKYDGSLSDDAQDSDPVYTTGGIDATIRDFGNPQGYTTNALAYSDFVTMEKTLSRERAPYELMLIDGVNFDVQADAVLKGKLDFNGMNYAAFGKGDAKQRAIDFGFDSFRFSKRTYHKKTEDFMNYLPVTGFSGSPYPNMAYVLPIDRVANPKPSGPDDEEVDTLCVRYKANDRINRFVKHWTRDVTITNLDRIEFNHMSEAGLMFAMLNQTIRLYAV